MDFSNRNVQPQQPTAPSHVAAGGSSSSTKKNRSGQGKWTRIITGLLVTAVVILLIGLVVFIGFGNNTKSENSYVDSNKLQAVFLNTGQVYFGNITTLNNRYFVLTNIYYLQTSGGSGSSTSSTTSSSATNVTLVKLGCELHQPYDQMVINRDQVTFWENLQSSGQVATAVATFQKQNPNGQKCSDQSSSSSSTTNSVQNANSGNTGSSTPTTSTTPATTTTKP